MNTKVEKQLLKKQIKDQIKNYKEILKLLNRELTKNKKISKLTNNTNKKIKVTKELIKSYKDLQRSF